MFPPTPLLSYPILSSSPSAQAALRDKAASEALAAQLQQELADTGRRHAMEMAHVEVGRGPGAVEKGSRGRQEWWKRIKLYHPLFLSLLSLSLSLPPPLSLVLSIPSSFSL
jgi:hypothetical protein